MSRIIHIGLIVGATISFAAASLTSVHALDVSRVQLGVADLGGVACPRDAKVTAWAHTDGPGTVKFIIRNDGGGKTGELSANAVKGPTGNWLATYSQTFKVTTDVSIRYKAEAVGHGKSSNWVNFKATCGPQVRTSKGTATKSGAKPPAKKASDANRPQPRTKKTTKKSGAKPPAKKSSDVNKGKPSGEGKPIPSGQGKPIPSAGKPVKQCGGKISVVRLSAVTRAGGRLSAQAGWAIEVKKRHPNNWGNWNNAKDRNTSCKFAGLWNCTASARPCEP